MALNQQSESGFFLPTNKVLEKLLIGPLPDGLGVKQFLEVGNDRVGRPYCHGLVSPGKGGLSLLVPAKGLGVYYFVNFIAQETRSFSLGQ
jgi:hypothetical protein